MAAPSCDEASEQAALTCSLQSLLLDDIDSPALLAQYDGELLMGLSHPDQDVKQLCLKQILRAATENPQELSLHRDIIIRTAHLLCDDNLAVAKEAEKVIVTLGRTNEGLEAIFHQDVVDKMHDISNVSDTLRFRVYETMTGLMCQSEEALVLCARSGFLQRLVNEVYRDDLLTQLNSLELLKDLVLTSHGLRYLDDQGVVGKLEELLVTSQADALAGFLLPGLVKFFGNVASLYPKEVCGRFKDFMALVFDLLQGPDVSLAVLAAETLGVIGSTLEGKLALEKQGNQMFIAMKQIGGLTTNAPTEIRVRALAVVSALISLEGEMQTTEMLYLTEKWFEHLLPRPMETLKTMAVQPFTELRCSSALVLRALANLPWGQRHLHEQAGFTEYLLDRSTEKTKEGKDSKFAIIKTLAESPTTAGIFDAPSYMRCRQYVNDGPYYVRTEAAIAYEEES